MTLIVGAPEIRRFTSAQGRVTLHLNEDGEDIWIEAQYEHDHVEILEILGVADEQGVELIDEEYEPELTDTGVRLYCRMKGESA